MIQPTSVIQSTPSLQANSLPKGNIILVSKPNSVIHTTGGGGGGGAIQTLQVELYITLALAKQLLLMDVIDFDQVIDNSGLHEDENTKKRREILARRPSYRKILNELGGCEISGKFFFVSTLRTRSVLINNPVTLQKTKETRLAGSIRIAAVLRPLPLPAIIKGPRRSLSLARTIRLLV